MEASLQQALSQFQDPYLQTDLVAAGVVTIKEVSEKRILLDITLGFPCERYAETLSEALMEHLHPVVGDVPLIISVGMKVHAHAVQTGQKVSKKIKNVIAVGSGKGGVGKSTVAANLALALAAEGARVGMLDADIYGPSQPQMFGAPEKAVVKGKRFQPLERHGIQVMSIGYLVDNSAAMIWRGPMVSGALQQLFNDTEWDDLDYLIVDLPPGTGDVQLTLAQKIPVSGAVIVTTPQDIALADVQRAVAMFEKVSIPVLGVVENMSTHICSACGHEAPIFGQGGGEKVAVEHGIKLLGQLPLDARICEGGDAGTPIVATEPEGTLAQPYIEAARHTTATLALRPKDYSSKFPTISVVNS